MIKLKKLHLGCGIKTPDGWLNLDGSWNAWLAKYPIMRRLLKFFGIIKQSLLDVPWDSNIIIHDVRKPLPFPNESLSAIYASHLLEHLYLEEAKDLLIECYRILEPNGILRMLVPDLRSIILEYLDAPEKSSDSKRILNRADRLNERLCYRYPQPTSGSLIYKVYTALTDFHLHKWSYDAESLINYFRMAGFIEVQEMQLFQSRIESIKEIEDPKMILDGVGICVEGLKPPE
jgi:SAM-dependent methyltransferase